MVQIPGTASAYRIQNGVRLDGVGTYDYASQYNERKDKVRKSVRTSSGWRPPLPWSHAKFVHEDPVANYECVNRFNPANPVVLAFVGDIQYSFPWMIGYVPDVPRYIADGALNQALSNLSQHQIGLGEDFFTRQETADMVADRAKNIARSTRRFADSHPRDWGNVKKWQTGLRRYSHNIPLRWLEVQYGWVPALLDVKEAFDTMKRIDKDGAPERVNVKGFKSVKSSTLINVRASFPPTDKGFGDPYGINVVTRRDDSVGCFVRLDYEMVNPLLASLQQLGLANPAALAWELLPYSFVVDWFLPVGQYLNSWTGDLGYRFLGGSSSVFRTLKGRVVSSSPGWGNNPYISGSAHCTAGKIDNWAVDRSVFKSSPAPRLPHFKNPLSLGHFANAMALLVSAFRH